MAYVRFSKMLPLETSVYVLIEDLAVEILVEVDAAAPSFKCASCSAESLEII